MLGSRGRYKIPSRDERLYRDTEQIAGIDRHLADVELRLDDRIKEVKNDLKNDIQEIKENHQRLENRLWRIVGGGSVLIITALITIIAALITKGN